MLSDVVVISELTVVLFAHTLAVFG
jgi:hypothetical protein